MATALQTVPHLTTASSGPLHEIETHLLAHQQRIEQWLRRQWLVSPAPFYASVDLRNAGFKLAPVDTNLFPAGFNNLNPDFAPLCVQAIQAGLERVCPTAARIAIVPENHTRNVAYLESLAVLAEMIETAGYEVRIGSIDPELTEPRTPDLPSGRRLRIEPLARTGDRVHVGDFRPCAIVNNNDLAAGRPAALEGIEQPILPPLALGWSERLKSKHFLEYSCVARELGEHIGLDPWLIDPLARNCGAISFMRREGLSCLENHVAELLEQIAAKYAAYGIEREPFVVIKADAGTYGLAVMTVRSVEDVRVLSRRQRKQMNFAKGGREVSQVILQEGVYTFETLGEPAAVAEPVVYMIDHFVVGGFYRVHSGRSQTDNLNAPGMHFEPLAFAEPCNTPHCQLAPDACTNRFYAYGVIARLALLAAAREVSESRAGPPGVPA